MKESARRAGSARRLENQGPFVKQADLITVGHEPLATIFMFRGHGTQSHFTGDLSERDVIERFMATWRVIASAKADRMETKYALGVSSAIPARDTS